MQQSKRWLSSSCLCHHESMMQHAKGSFASSAALTGAEGRRRICKALLKQHVRLKTVYGQCMQQIERLLSSFCLCHFEPMMQDTEGSFASAAALTGAERCKRICKALLKWHVRLNRGDGHCFQQSQVCLPSFIRSLYQHMMQGSEASFASPAAQTSAEGRRRICIMQLKRACQAEPRRWPLLPAESGLPVKLHQESLSTYDARVRSKLCISSSSDKR